jgi:hypothetical protein
VAHPIRRVTACDASARLLVPTCRLEALAGLIEVMGEERGVRTGRRSVDPEQGARDGRVGFAPAILKLCAIGDLLREGMREGTGTPRVAASAELGRRKAPSDAASRRADRPRRAATDWHARPITAAA